MKDAFNIFGILYLILSLAFGFGTVAGIAFFIASIIFILLQLIMTFRLKRKERIRNEQNQDI